MNAVSKATAFPATVQPGIPKLGELPDGWVKAPLGQFLREKRRPIKMKDNEEYRLVTAKRARGGIVERERLTGSQVAVKSQFLIEQGDFLISKRQIVHGACGLVPDDLTGSIVSNEYSILTCTNEIDLNFLSYLSHSIFFQQTCFHSSIGVHIEKMIFKLDRWLKWDFHLPPLPEQRKIAEILSIWDRAIETTEALLVNARTQKRALMQSLLTGERRFPEFEGPEWRDTRFGEFFDSRRERGCDGVPTLSVTLDRGLVRRDTIERKMDTNLTAEEHLRVQPGDIAYNMMRMWQGASGLASEDAIVSPAYIVLAPRPNIDPKFAAHLFKLPEMIHRFWAYSYGLTNDRLRLYFNDFSKVPVRMPGIHEQRKIAKVISASDDEIEKLTAERSKLQSEKKALMQQLLTGKRRV